MRELWDILRANWDRATAVVLTIAGAVALTLGWAGSADTPFVAGQVPYLISGGLVGIFLLGIAGTLWISADLRDEWRRLDELDPADAVGQHTEDAG